ncbi:MAG TPA: hypothetical protein VGB14_09760 [Acidimicrobiales bacterium]|jgi:hypothetical protein
MTDAATTPAAAPSTRDQVLAQLFARPARHLQVTLAQDPNDADELVRLRGKVYVAKQLAYSRANATTAADLADAEAALEEFSQGIPTVTFTFEAIDPDAVDALEGEHKPTEKQVKDYKREAAAQGNPNRFLRWNPDTYPPALVAATCVKVEFSTGGAVDGLTVDEATRMWSSKLWPAEDLAELFGAAQHVARASTSVGDLGKGSATTTS